MSARVKISPAETAYRSGMAGKIKDFRKSHFLSQDAFGDIIGCGRNVVKKIEYGTGGMSIYHLYRLRKRYEFDTGLFIDPDVQDDEVYEIKNHIMKNLSKLDKEGLQSLDWIIQIFTELYLKKAQ